MPRNSIRITSKSPGIPEDPRTSFAELSSKDFSGKELALYLLWPFARTFYAVGCLFLDLLVIPFLFEIIPPVRNGIIYSDMYIGSSLIFYYFIILEFFILILVGKYEFQFYRIKLTKERESELLWQIYERTTGKKSDDQGS
ncbi:MAG: hypothetical protein M1162_04290 [Candidatus Thermoplasmatota archaeon]|nr:hypothetical protein [Candidatus Thermoplasmatota archaeon]